MTSNLQPCGLGRLCPWPCPVCYCVAMIEHVVVYVCVCLRVRTPDAYSVPAVVNGSR